MNVNEPDLRFVTETVDLLRAKPLENLVREGWSRFHLFLDNKVHDKVHDKIHDKVHNKVHDKVHHKVHHKDYDQVHDKVHAKAHNTVHDTVHDKVRNKVYQDLGTARHGNIWHGTDHESTHRMIDPST